MNYRKLYNILLFSFLTLTFVSCSSKGDEGSTEKEEHEVSLANDSLALKVAVMPTQDCFPALVAEDLGIYDAMGLKVYLKKCMALSECRYDISHKLVDAAFLDSTLVSLMQGKDGEQLTLSFPTNLSWKLISSKKSRVMKSSQLKEKMIASDSYGMSRRLASEAVDSLVKKKNIVFFIQVEDVAVRYNMLTMGNIDAAMLPEPYSSVAVKDGCRVLDDWTHSPNGTFAIRSSRLNDKRTSKQIELFEKAYKAAQDSIAKRPALLDKYKRL